MIEFVSLPGLIPYPEASRLQAELVEKRIADSIPDTLLFLEHQPVITQGRGLQWIGKPRERHTPVPSSLPPGILFCETERGGDLTYHGPGQLVVYPIFKLDGQGITAKHDVTGFIRMLEQILIDSLAKWGIYGERRSEASGVWVSDRKLASIGIAVRRWVTFHGMAINVTNDLKPFHLISPCGLSPDVMTSLVKLRPVMATSNWRGELESLLESQIRDTMPHALSH